MWECELQEYNNDIGDIYLAILMTAMFNKVKYFITNDSQYDKLNDFQDKFLNSYFPYYCAYGENCVEYEEVLSGDGSVINDVIEINYHTEGDLTVATFENVNHDSLMQVFDSYFKKYKEDNLVSSENMYSYKGNEDRLYNLLTKESYNLEQFHVTDISYIKPICCAYNDDLIFIHDMKLKLDENFNVVLFDICADFQEFVENTKPNNNVKTIPQVQNTNRQVKKQSKKAPNTKKSTYHMQPKQWKLFLCLLKIANEQTKERLDIAEVSKEHLVRNGALADTKQAQDTAKTRFNEIYNKIKHNKEGEYEDLIYPKVSDTRYYEFNVSKVINLYKTIMNNEYLSEEYQKHRYFLVQIID